MPIIPDNLGWRSSTKSASTPAASDDNTLGHTDGSRWITDDGREFVCTDNSTGAAVWSETTASGGAGGDPFSDIVHDAGATTTGTDTLVLSLTPTAGTYAVSWDGWGFPGANNASQQMAIYVAGTKEAGSQRTIMRGGGQTAALEVGFSCTARVTVNGSQAIEGRLTGVAADSAQILENTLSIIEVST